jgi:hypothetical protein
MLREEIRHVHRELSTSALDRDENKDALGVFRELATWRYVCSAAPNAVIDLLTVARDCDVMRRLLRKAGLPAGQPSSGTAPSPAAASDRKKRRGPTPKMADHRKVAEVVSRYGADWRSEDKLMQIAKELDQLEVPIPPSWSRKPTVARTWRRAEENRPRLVILKIKYHLMMAER